MSQRANGFGGIRVSKWQAPLFALAVFAAVALVLLAPAVVFAAPITSLADGTLDTSGATICDGRAGWVVNDGSDNEIVTWTASTGAVQLTSNAFDDSQVQVSAGRVVWSGGASDAQKEIYTWTPAGGTVRLTNNSYSDINPQISGDRIVWQGYDGSGYEIYTWTPGGGTVPLSNNSVLDDLPQVSGDRVVWESGDDWNKKVLTWTPAGGQAVVTPGTAYGINPVVSGDRVVYFGTDGVYEGSSDVYTWTPTDSIVYVTGSTLTNYQVSGDRIVWGNGKNICTWTPTDSFEAVSTDSTYYDGNSDYPRIDGDRVVWERYYANDYDVYTWTPAAGLTRLSLTANDAHYPVVSGDQVIWEESNGTRSTVKFASLAAQIAGTVQGNNGGTTVALAGATVTVALDSSDPHFDGGNPASNLIGTALTGPTGDYSLDVSTFRGSGLPTGSIVDVSASAPGYVGAKQVGAHSQATTICSFLAFNTLIDSSWEDRRLQKTGTSQTYMRLLPSYLGSLPAIDSLSTEYGPTGGKTSVVVHGNGFVALSGASAVTFGGVNALSYTVDSDAQLTVVTPPHAYGPVEMRVTAMGGAPLHVASDRFIYTQVSMSNIAPHSGPSSGGNSVEVYGSGGFTPVSGPDAVRFGDVSATSYVVDSDTQITAVAPPHAPGTVVVEIFDGGDYSVNNRTYTYLTLPAITDLSPSSGDVAGGNTVVIDGTDFTGLSGTSAVQFGGVDATSYKVIGTTSIQAVVPAHAAGMVRVKVTGTNGTSADTSADDYTYIYTPPRPTITSLSPAYGPLAGGTSVVITGNNFTGVASSGAVKFGTEDAASYTIDSVNQITAVSPAHATGAVRVCVTADGGETFDTDADDFVYVPNYGTTEQFVPERITNNGYEDGVAGVSGDRVVFGAASDPTDYENGRVYTWTPSEGTVLLSTTSRENQRARVYGDRVVWYGYVGGDLGNGEIFTWTPTTGLVQITKNSGDDQTPEVYGDRVVWAGWDSNRIYQIYTWTPSGGTKKISSETSNPAYPVVSGDRISWCGDGTRVVKTWTAASGIVNVSELEDAGYKYGLKASGDRLVWTSNNGVFTWTPADGIVRITPDAADAQISGDRVVWSIWSGLNFQVFTWTPTGGIIQLSAGSEGGVAPQISGDFVVWVAYPASGAVIRGWTPDGGIIEIAASQCVPFVSGDRVAWSAGDQADSDIYTAIVRPIISAAVSGNSPASGPTTGGTTVVITGSGFSALPSSAAASTASGASTGMAASSSSSVSFGDVPALSYTIESDKQITAVAPPHAAGKVDVYVQTSTGASATAGTGNDYSYVPAALTRIENTDSRIGYSGTWTLNTTPSGVYSGGSCSYSQSAGATVTVSFTGTTLDWIATRDETGRSATVSLDGGAPMTVSLYSLETQYQKRVWSTGWLPMGTHVVTITRVTGPLNVDAFDTNGTLVSFGRYDQSNNANIQRTGSWTDYANTAAYGGTYGRSLTSGATATVWFSGTKIAWIGMTGSTPGIVDVYLDDVEQTTLDLYSSPAKYQVALWTSPALTNGTHHMDLVRNKDSLSTEYLVLDAVDIWGTIQPAPPTVTGLNPTSGTTAGSTSVVITGTNLTGATSVTFGGSAATGVVVNSATQIACSSPAHTAGTVDVQVTTPAGSSVTSGAADDFTYAAPGVPAITSLSPATGSVDGGTSVTITGTAFTGLSGSAAVQFGGVNATSYVVNSSTKITAVAPAHAAGTVRVQVTASGGTTPDTATDDFTYSVAPPVIRYDQFGNTNIVKTGTWADYSAPASYLGKYGRSKTSGATATAWFSGTQIDWIAMMGTTTGTADVYLDGVKKASINLAANPAKYQQNVWSSGPLSPGLHSFKIVNTSTKYLTLDALDIAGTISAPPTRYEQTDTHIAKVGSWTNFSATKASGTNYGRTLTSGASATITFHGSRLDWIAMKGTTTGYAMVYLDDVLATPTPIDLTSASAAYQVPVWSTGDLGAPAVHKVRIERYVYPNGAGSTKYLTLDAVDIWGTIQ